MGPEVHFTNVGADFTKGREMEILEVIRSLEWRDIAHLSTYLPFELEQLVRMAIDRNPLLRNAREYGSSGRFLPLDFVGVRSRFVDAGVECYFVSDGAGLTPVAQLFSEG